MPHPDIETLYREVVAFARHSMKSGGPLLPFGFSLDRQGQVAMVAAVPPEDSPTSEGVLDVLTKAFRQKARDGEMVCASLCYEVNIQPTGRKRLTDALCMDFEHESGESCQLVFPYKKGWFGKVRFEQPIGVEREPTFFV
jgi:hypothetical protein